MLEARPVRIRQEPETLFRMGIEQDTPIREAEPRPSHWKGRRTPVATFCYRRPDG